MVEREIPPNSGQDEYMNHLQHNGRVEGRWERIPHSFNDDHDDELECMWEWGEEQQEREGVEVPDVELEVKRTCTHNTDEVRHHQR